MYSEHPTAKTLWIVLKVCLGEDYHSLYKTQAPYTPLSVYA